MCIKVSPSSPSVLLRATGCPERSFVFDRFANTTIVQAFRACSSIKLWQFGQFDHNAVRIRQKRLEIGLFLYVHYGLFDALDGRFFGFWIAFATVYQKQLSLVPTCRVRMFKLSPFSRISPNHRDSPNYINLPYIDYIEYIG